MIDEIGNTYGHWSVLDKGSKSKSRSQCWVCQCSCGKIREIPGSELRRKDGTRMCNSCARRKARESLVDETFGRWLVLHEHTYDLTQNEYRYWCICECGNERAVSGSGLRGGTSKSCGCLNREISSLYIKEHRSGENHHFYNPNLTDEQRLLNHTGPEYQKFVDVVGERDKVCQYCDSDENLEAHHIESLGNSLNNNPNNGICLCFKHHRGADTGMHSIYGQETTRDNLEEFMASAVRSLVLQED